MSFRVNHIAVVVADLEAAAVFWRDLLGLPMGEVKDVPQEQVRIAFLEAGEAHLELVQPTSAAGGIASYLAKRGAGLHHVCLEVEGLEALMARLRAGGAELLNDTPKERDGWRYVFVHPRSTGGVLLELYERQPS